MTSLHAATLELTTPWTEMLTPEQTGAGNLFLEHQPRLLTLRHAITSNPGGTTPGQTLTSTRNTLNLAAFDLWERIDGQTRAALNAHSIRAPKRLGEAINLMGARFDALRNTNDLTTTDHSRYIDQINRWRDSIDGILDPPTRKEVAGKCPRCEAARVTIGGAETSALTAYYWRGHHPAATCQACGHLWHGDRELLELGFSINANMDTDELATLGVL